MLENFRQQALQVDLSACLLFFPAMVLPDSTFSLYLSVCLPVYLFMLSVGPCHSKQLLGSCMLPSVVNPIGSVITLDSVKQGHCLHRSVLRYTFSPWMNCCAEPGKMPGLYRCCIRYSM